MDEASLKINASDDLGTRLFGYCVYRFSGWFRVMGRKNKMIKAISKEKQSFKCVDGAERSCDLSMLLVQTRPFFLTSEAFYTFIQIF